MNEQAPEADLRPADIDGFEFAGRSLDTATGQVRLRYRLSGGGRSLKLEERFDFGPGVRVDGREQAVARALDLLHWIAGVSYWKVACRGRVTFADRRPDRWQAQRLEALYRGGLAELAWRNGMRRRHWPEMDGAGPGPGASPAPLGLARRSLVPMGGGKDSLVALERVRRVDPDADTVQVGNAALIAAVAERAGTRHRMIGRRLDPALAGLNRAGALNGHVPVTAINAAALALAALLWDYDAVVFANERSADEPTLVAEDGSPVNHQFSKSFAFEEDFGQWVQSYVAADLDVFSILRRDRELAICREFSGLSRYHDVFSSCNRNFHLDGPRTARWCGDCPKCRFVYLGLAPFLSPAAMSSIFGADLLAHADQEPGFAALLSLGAPRPFECVGEPAEARAAVCMLAESPGWKGHGVVRALAARLDGVDVPSPSSLMTPGGPHRIPSRFLA